MKSTEIKNKIAAMVADKIDSTGLLPWDKGFISNYMTPINRISKKEYRGINAVLLSCFGCGTNEFVTYKQAQTLGGKVKAGEHGLPVVWYSLWNCTQKKPYDKKTAKPDDKVAPLLKYSTVFEVSQCEGIEPKRKAEEARSTATRDDIQTWLNVFADNTTLAIEHTLDTACYVPSSHSVRIRDIGEFKTDDMYYSTLFHECTHSTGVALERFEPDNAKFGSEVYAKEEVVAELGSLFMRDYFGVQGEREQDNSVAYVKGWSERIRKNPDWLISGANAAQKAFDYMLVEGGVDLD